VVPVDGVIFNPFDIDDGGDDPSNLPPDLFPGGLRVLPARSLYGRTIILDPGHGGHDAGASGLYNKEKELCLRMILEVKQALEARGASVILTRSSDMYVSLEQRTTLANTSGADLFISIHCNSMPRRNSASGSQTYYYTPQSTRLARALHGRVVGSVKGKDGGIRRARFWVVRQTVMPSVLLEVAFINHTGDEQVMAATDFQATLGEALAQGVLDYFGRDLP